MICDIFLRIYYIYSIEFVLGSIIVHVQASSFFSDYLQLLKTLCFMTNSKTYPVIVVDTVETDKHSSD